MVRSAVKNSSLQFYTTHKQYPLNFPAFSYHTEPPWVYKSRFEVKPEQDTELQGQSIISWDLVDTRRMASSAESDGRKGHLSEVGRHLVAASGEFVGTFLFLYFGYAGNIMAILQAPSLAMNGGLASNTEIWIAMSYGFSLLVSVWAFFRISGGLFNPAVSRSSLDFIVCS